MFQRIRKSHISNLIDTGADTDILDGLFREGRIDSCSQSDQIYWFCRQILYKFY